MADISQILKAAKKRRRSVYVCLAGDKVAELGRLEHQLATLGGKAWEPSSLGDSDPRTELAKKVAAARKAVRAAETEFVFEALGDKEWSDLIAAHPSQDKGQMWDPETFGPALISACAVDPVMTDDQVRELFQLCNAAQRDELWRGAYEVNTEAPGIPFSLTDSGILDSLTAAK
ncbi:hypothetical protein ACFV0B_11490 [Streptomyces xanthophaeus]|uniref:hypothetical protein n=1 Tax=Streptomyces xanthophaeus TaxID=67385 RepID=UPI00369953FE